MSNCKTSLTDIGNIERDPVFLSQKGKPGGVATLDANGKVPLAQIDITAMFTERDPVYLADRGVAFGCATLDGSARVVREQLGSGTFDSTTFLRGDGTWAVPPGGGGGGVPEGWKLTGSDISLLTSTSKVVVGVLPTIAKFGVVGDNPADITSIIRAATAQSANILEVQNSVGTILVAITPGAFTLDVTGDTRITGKLTVTGAIDPTSVLLSGGTALYYESNDGSTAPVSGPATGRIRYDNTVGLWQISMQGGPYTDMVSGSGNAFRMVKWISTAETADGPVESDAGNTFLAPNVDDAILLGTSSARFSRISASDIIGIFLSQGDAEYSSRLLFDRLAMGTGGGTGVPDVSLRRSAASTFAISNDLGGGDVIIGVVNDALYLDAKNGSNAAVSGATTGRLRYNNTYGYWEQSTLGNPYVPVGDVRDIFRYSMLNNLA